MLSPIELERTLETLRNNCYPEDWKNITEKLNGITLYDKLENLRKLIQEIKKDIEENRYKLSYSKVKSDKYRLIEIIEDEFEINTNTTITF